MNDSILANLFESLDMTVMERLNDGSFQFLGSVPDWFKCLCPEITSGKKVLSLGGKCPFLENFLVDAEGFWRAEATGRLRSGPWIETDSSGNDYALEATALCVGKTKVLLIELGRYSHAEKQFLIQKGRELSLDYHRLEKLEEALRESEERYRRLVELSPDAMAVHSEGIVVYINTAGMKLFGATSLEEVIGKPILDFVHPDYWEIVKERVSKIYESGEQTELIEEKMVRLDGQSIDVEVLGVPITYQGQTAVQVVIRDISERKRAEKALQESETRLNTILDAVQMGIVIIDPTTRVIVEANPSALEMLGAPKEQVVGAVCHQYICPAARGHCPIADYGQNVDNSERVLLKANGERIPILKTVTPIMLDGRAHLLESFVDISEQKRAEEALKESEERFRELAELLPQPIFELDVEGNFTYGNRRAFETFGYTQEELTKGINALRLFIQEDREKVKQNIRKRLTGEEFEDHEYTGLRKDGSTFPILIYSTPIIRGNKPVGIRGIILDITERKRAEEMLRKNNEMFQEKNRLLMAFDKIGQAILSSLDLEQVLDFLAKQILEIGIFRSLMIALVDEQTRSVEVVRNLRRRSNGSVAQGDLDVVGFRYNLDDPNITAEVARTGEMQVIEGWDARFDPRINESRRMRKVSYFIPVKKADVVLAILATGSRIEEKEEMLRRIETMNPLLNQVVIALEHAKLFQAIRESAEALRASEERLKLTISSMDDLVFVIDKNGIFLDYYQTEKVDELYVLPEAFIGKSFKEVLPPHVVKSLDAAINAMETTNTIQQFDYPIQFEDKELWYNAKVSVHQNSLGEFDGVVVVARSITERKRMENNLMESESKFRTLTEMASAAIFIYQGERTIYANPAVKSITGYSEAELMEMNFWDIIHPDFQQLIRERGLSRQRNEQVKTQYEVKILKKDGQERWLDFTGSLIEYQGKPSVLGVAFDITERRQAEEALRESEEKYRLLLENANEAILVTQDERIKFLNPKLIEISGYSKEELTSRPFMEFIHPEDRDMVHGRYLKRLKREELPHVYSYRAIHKDGNIQWMEISAINISWEGKPATLSFLSNITERKQAEESLQQAHKELAAKAAQLEEANAELAQYAYVVSHDLKAPLRAIHNYADFLREDLEGTLDEEQEEYLNGLRRAVSQGEELVDGLLVLSRTGRMSEPAGSIDIGVFLRELIASLDLSEDTEVVMENDWPTIDADPALLKQIFQNLITNAVKFNHSPCKRVEIGWHPVGDECYELFVRDNGIGIEAGYLEQIFRVFQRLHTTDEYDGTGIGLAIVRKAISKLHGSIRVESKPGEGSTFFVALPKTQEES